MKLVPRFYVVVFDVTTPKGSEALVGSVDTGNRLLLLLFFFLLCLHSLCLMSPPLLLVFGDGDVDAAYIAADKPSRRYNAPV